jgi:hypothetical protein
MSIGRMVLLALVMEALAVLVVAVFGPSNPAAAQAYAERLGYWVGPIAGFTLCLAGGWLVSRRPRSGQVARGLLLGTLVAGSLGGYLATKTTRR